MASCSGDSRVCARDAAIIVRQIKTGTMVFIRLLMLPKLETRKKKNRHRNSAFLAELRIASSPRSSGGLRFPPCLCPSVVGVLFAAKSRAAFIGVNQRL